MNTNPLLLEHLHLSVFGDDARYRCLEKIGENRQIILRHILHILKEHHNVGLDMVFMDWTSSHFEAKPTELIKTGTAEIIGQTDNRSPSVWHKINTHRSRLDSAYNPGTSTNNNTSKLLIIRSNQDS